jgi:RNA polymerase sigma-70 factor (ECF subfamily)
MAQVESRLRQFIEHESGALVGTLRYYLYRAGLMPSDADAKELLSDVIIEALEHEARFQGGGQPKAWLLGIAANLVKRRRAEVARREQREPLIRDLHGDEAGMSDDELFDWMASLTGAVEELDGGDDAAHLLSRVSPDDARVLRLAVLCGLDGDALAAELGISPGAARVRLHRALNRLRAALGGEHG